MAGIQGSKFSAVHSIACEWSVGYCVRLGTPNFSLALRYLRASSEFRATRLGQDRVVRGFGV
jgi:hypothetical protein